MYFTNKALLRIYKGGQESVDRLRRKWIKSVRGELALEGHWISKE